MSDATGQATFADRVGVLIVRHHYSRAAAERRAHLEELARIAAQQPTLAAALAVMGVAE